MTSELDPHVLGLKSYRVAITSSGVRPSSDILVIDRRSWAKTFEVGYLAQMAREKPDY